MKKEAEPARGLRPRSSIDADVWHPSHDSPGAYEWWYFDALSDDGRDALVIIFLADFIFSPRYNRAATLASPATHKHLRPHDGQRSGQFPAVVFCLYRDGRPLVRAINEYAAPDFSADTTRPACRINHSSFQLKRTPDGAHVYAITLDETLRRGRRLQADFEWIITEGNFSEASFPTNSGAVAATSDGGDGTHDAEDARDTHDWNMVAPRCRVRGSIRVAGRDAPTSSAQLFQGTGYHDHNRDTRWMPAAVAEWQWGRAHFDDATAIFYRYREHQDDAATTRLFLVRDGALSTHAAHMSDTHTRRHHFGLRYPTSLRFNTVNAASPTEKASVAQREKARVSSPLEETITQPMDIHATLHIRQSRILDSSFFYLRFLAQATLDTGDRHTRQAPAITEHLAPHALRARWLDWLIDMRIGRDGRAALLH